MEFETWAGFRTPGRTIVGADESTELWQPSRLNNYCFIKQWTLINMWRPGGSPGLVVMGVDSRSKGHGFESWHRILDGHDIFHIHLL